MRQSYGERVFDTDDPRINLVRVVTVGPEDDRPSLLAVLTHQTPRADFILLELKGSNLFSRSNDFQSLQRLELSQAVVIVTPDIKIQRLAEKNNFKTVSSLNAFREAWDQFLSQRSDSTTTVITEETEAVSPQPALPPPPPEQQMWYVLGKGMQQFMMGQVADMQLDPTASVCRVGDTGWSEIGKLSEFRQLYQRALPPPAKTQNGNGRGKAKRVLAQEFCTQCSARLASNAKFCMQCGANQEGKI